MIAYPLGVGGVRTRVLEAGRGDAVVVLLHGLGARADRWRLNLDPLAAAGYHAYALDFPGHGFADKGADFPYGVPGYAAFVADFMRAQTIDRAALVGTSLGGHVAAWLACEQPEAVGALVLVGTLGLAPLGAEARRVMAASVQETSRAGIERKLRYVLGDHQFTTEEWIDEEYRINNSPGAREAFARLAAYLVDDAGLVAHGVAARLAALVPRIPTVLVWGKADAAVPLAVGEQGSAALGGVPLVTLDGAGHLPYLERADEFNATVVDFLGGPASRTR